MHDEEKLSSRREFLGRAVALGAAAALPACVGPGGGALPRARRPNIVIVLADDLGRECLGCYGSVQYHTPNLDRLSPKGIRFERAYADPLCTPSRVKLMTGLSNARNYHAFSILLSGRTTFAHLLKKAGYRTAVAGNGRSAAPPTTGPWPKGGPFPGRPASTSGASGKWTGSAHVTGIP